MKSKECIRIICMALLIALVLQPVMAIADIITSNGKFVEVYENKGDETSGTSIRIVEQESTYDEGWYKITKEGYGYVRAVSVSVLNATPVPTTPPATTNPTLMPGATATPEPLKGAVDEEYTGTIISYTVPQGGLMLFDKIDGKQVESIKAGVKVNLTTVLNGDGSVNTSWYSTYSNGKTYYVPASVINNVNVSATNPPLGSVASVMLTQDDVQLYTKYTRSTTYPYTYSLLPVDYITSITGGKRINARYVTGIPSILSYNLNGKDYYFYSSNVEENSQSTATVVGNSTTELMSTIFVPASTKLFREKSNKTGTSYYVLKNDETLYGVRLDSEWYKVTYLSEIFYLEIANGQITSQIATNDTIKTDTFWVTIGPNGGRLYRTRPTNLTTATVDKRLNAGQSVLVSPYDSLWYIYTELDGNTAINYYLYRLDLSDQTSTASIVGGYKITLRPGTELYDKATSSAKATGIKLDAGTYVVQVVNDQWYSIVYDNLTYYIKKEALQSAASSNRVTKTVTLNAGKSLYLEDTYGVSNLGDIWGPKTLAVWPSEQQGWDPAVYYETFYNGQSYMIAKSELQALEEVSDEVDLQGRGVYLHWNDSSADPAIDDDPNYTGPLTLRQATVNNRGSAPASDYYATTLPNGREYIIKKSDMQGVNITYGASSEESTYALEPIAIVSDNKDFYVTIGLTGAPLYMDAGCTKSAGVFLAPGEVVKARKQTDRLYLVNNYYLSVRDIASIRGGNDAAANKTTIAEESVTEVAKGQVDNSFNSTILSYTTPAGGMWLYYDAATKVPAMILDGGKKIQLNYHSEVSGNPVYTIWYGGNQYFVPGSALSVDKSKTQVGGTYSILLKEPVDLYKKYTPYASTSTSYLSNPYLTEPAGTKLYANTRVNVYIQQYVPTTSSYPATVVKDVLIYRYTDINNNTYYFYGNGRYGTSNQINNDDSTYAALYTSNADVNLITRLQLKLNATDPDTAKFYTTPSLRSGYNLFPTLYADGVKYENDWYKVMYNDKVYYINTADITGSEQVVVANSVTSTTYTVVIGTSNAVLYTVASKGTVNTTYPNGTNAKPGAYLSAGTTVLASRVDSSWYSCSIDGVTLYFLASAVANTSTTASISSYIITLYDGEKITLYNTISDTSHETSQRLTGSGFKANGDPGLKYTLRYINREWSSVVYNGRTYYIKNTDINDSTRQNSTPIATTSVGNTYRITLGKSTDVYSDIKLTNRRVALPAGTQISGVKKYVDTATPDKQLVFEIKYNNGVTGYINANDVTGVYEGDEVAEAKLAAQEAAKQGSNSSVAIGGVVMHEMEVGSVIYLSMDTQSTSALFTTKQTVQLTKVDASWYSLDYNGLKWYYPASKVEISSSGGTQVTVSIGETYNYTFKENTPLYKEPETYALIAEVILAASNLTLPIKRISDSWYELTYNGETYYVPSYDIKLPYIANTTPTPDTPSNNLQHDGTGYITPMLLISPDSGSVNMRKTASTSSTILARIPKGVQVKNNSYTVDASKNVWYNITYGGMTGYVLGDYVSPIGSASTGNQGNPANDIGKTLLVDMSEVNVRSGPGTTYSIVGKVTKGTGIVPLDYKTGSDNMVWYSFKYTSTITAYIRSDYLLGSAATTAEQSGNVAIKAGGTNLRTGPGESFSLVTKLARDVIVTIIGTGTDSQNNVWYRVTMDGQSGYVRSDLVRPLTSTEQSGLIQNVVNQYAELRSGDKGPEVLALQQQLIKLGYLSQGDADGSYGTKTINAIKAFQKAKGMTSNGIASSGVQAALFNTASVPSGSTQALDWFATGFTLITKNPNISVYDTMVGISWNAKYINGANHADIVPASKTDADKLKAYNITGSYIRRPVVVNIAGQNYAGSMYAVGHGSQSYVSYFNGVMCIHFTGSKTHGTNAVDKDHQSAIQDALKYSSAGQ